MAGKYNAGGSLIRGYTMGLNLDEPLARIENSGAVHYYHSDILGSIVALTNSSGGVTTQYNYSPFGVTEVTGTDAVGLSQPFRFTGREWDAETGMYYYRARYYAPEMGRFVSEDPIRFASGEVNWYAYVGNNPVNMVDPLGLYFLFDKSDARLYWVNDETGKVGPSWRAVSGNNSSAALPNGYYLIGTEEKPYYTERDNMMDEYGEAFKFRLYPQFDTGGRSGLLIHPDGGPAGTAGCIGLKGLTRGFRIFINELFKKHKTTRLELCVRQ